MKKALLSNGCGKVRESCKLDKDCPYYGYGYPWPPKNYTCSFCQREFKSAQALGGHMNIHRRDRAKLRAQSPNRDDSGQNPNLSSTPNRNPNPKPDPYNPDHQTTTAMNSVWILPKWDTDNPNNYLNPTNLPPSSSQTNKIYSHQYSVVSLSLSSLQPSTKDGKNLVKTLDLGRDFQGEGEKCKDLTSLEDPPPPPTRLHHHHHHHDHNQARVSKNNGYTKEPARFDLELCHGEPREDLDLELRLGI